MFFTKLLNLLLQYAKLQAKGTVVQAMMPVGPYLQRLSAGIGCVVVGVLSFSLTVLCLVFSLFLGLIHRTDWAIAGLWTSLATGVLGFALVIVSAFFFRKPHVRP